MDRQTSIDYLLYQLNALFTNILITDHPNHHGTGHTQITFIHNKTHGNIQFFNPNFIKVSVNNNPVDIFASVQQVATQLKELTFRTGPARTEHFHQSGY